MSFLGIDIGTGGTRSVIIDENGAVIATATAAHAPFASPQVGWAEQDPHDWWRAAVESIREVLKSHNAAEIKGIGLSGQMHGATLLDKNDQVLRPALLWCDQRTEKQCRDLDREIGRENLIRLVCNPAITGFTLPKLLWSRENEPEIWNQTTTVLLPKDYVRLRLSGDKATDVADASGTLLFDVQKRNWSDEMFDRLGLNRSLVPKVYESIEVTGTVNKRAAAETGLIEGTPIVAGAGDNAAGAVGMGIVAAGNASATIGTSGVFFVTTDQPKFDLNGRIHTLCHAVPDRWHMTGVTLSAGFSLRWFRENFGAGKSFEELGDSAEAITAGSEGLFWLPYLMGERTPHLDAHARAAFIGLTATHTNAHAVRAVMEGVAFSLRDCLSIFRELDLPIDKVRLGGGGAKSPIWRKIQADVYAATVETIAAEEGAAFGAALLAGVGTGGWKTVDEACETSIRISSTLEPESANTAVYDRAFQTYQKIYPALKEVFQDD